MLDTWHVRRSNKDMSLDRQVVTEMIMSNLPLLHKKTAFVKLHTFSFSVFPSFCSFFCGISSFLQVEFCFVYATWKSKLWEEMGYKEIIHVMDTFQRRKAKRAWKMDFGLLHFSGGQSLLINPWSWSACFPWKQKKS